MDKGKLYREFFNAFKSAHPTIPAHKDLDKRVGEVWRDIKHKHDFECLANELINKWTLAANQKKITLDKFWVSKFTQHKNQITLIGGI